MCEGTVTKHNHPGRGSTREMRIDTSYSYSWTTSIAPSEAANNVRLVLNNPQTVRGKHDLQAIQRTLWQV